MDTEELFSHDIKPSIKLTKSEGAKGDVYYSWDVRINGITDEDLKRLSEINESMKKTYVRENRI